MTYIVLSYSNSRQNRSKKKMVGENAVTGVQGSCFLRVIGSRHYSRTPLFRSPKGNGKKFEIAGFRNNRGSVKGKGKSKGIRSSFEIAGTSN